MLLYCFIIQNRQFVKYSVVLQKYMYTNVHREVFCSDYSLLSLKISMIFFFRSFKRKKTSLSLSFSVLPNEAFNYCLSFLVLFTMEEQSSNTTVLQAVSSPSDQFISEILVTSSFISSISV